MREIKFRAWDGNRYISHDSLCCPSYSLGEILYGSGFIVEQFTGLHDKNGKEIYEGDIVRDYDEGFLYKVMFCEYHARFMFYDYLNDDYYDNQDIAEHEVIGNIHENPELLEGRE